MHQGIQNIIQLHVNIIDKEYNKQLQFLSNNKIFEYPLPSFEEGRKINLFKKERSNYVVDSTNPLNKSEIHSEKITEKFSNEKEDIKNDAENIKSNFGITNYFSNFRIY